MYKRLKLIIVGLLVIVLSGCSGVRKPDAPNLDLPMLVFTSNREDGKWQIFRALAGGDGVVQLTSGTRENWYPRISPDGTRIAFESYRDGNRNIYTMNIDGTGLQQMTPTLGEDRHAAWSPDGQKLVFHSRGNGHSNYQLYTVNADGTDYQRITFTDNYDTWASWSPDGRQIVFSSNRDGNYEIFRMDPDGSNQEQLTFLGKTNRNPVWSPNGDKIAFASSAAGDYQIYTLDLITGVVANLTDGPKGVDNTYPFWSLDGAELMFTSDRDGEGALYVMDSEGNNVRPLLSGPGINEYGSWPMFFDFPEKNTEARTLRIDYEDVILVDGHIQGTIKFENRGSLSVDGVGYEMVANVGQPDDAHGDAIFIDSGVLPKFDGNSTEMSFTVPLPTDRQLFSLTLDIVFDAPVTKIVSGSHFHVFNFKI